MIDLEVELAALGTKDKVQWTALLGYFDLRQQQNGMSQAVFEGSRREQVLYYVPCQIWIVSEMSLFKTA